MYVYGEFNNIFNSKKETIEFRRYCKDEGVCPIQLRIEAFKLCRDKNKESFKGILGLVKKIIKYRRNRILS
ncbi:MAG: hypothetical protein E6248_10270 [Clostridium sp.]|uniref:hypothetical protein n=1 Tax=Clostridium sp. TaxID=1506 RepID=UPI002911C77D|nr:hypothetical protein [Clostridium sp.]MDU5110824.1 hypothetical protein [Clostridium sp.]